LCTEIAAMIPRRLSVNQLHLRTPAEIPLPF
jgi:hypothetical protein